MDIRVTFRHAWAHMHPITMLYAMGVLWLDRTIANWGTLTHDFYNEETRRGLIKRRRGGYLLNKTNKSIEALKKTIYQGNAGILSFYSLVWH